MFSVIFSNFIGYDFLIFLAAGFNGFVYYTVNSSSEKLHRMMNHTVYVPDAVYSRKEVDREISSLKVEDVIAAHNRMDKFYSLFVNITGIFPLLGILGTVVSLLGLVSDPENVTVSFYGALTSTFWGLIFAIVFKFLDGVISPKIEYNEKSVERYFEKKPSDIPDAPAERHIPSDDDGVPDVEVIAASREDVPERFGEDSTEEKGGITELLKKRLGLTKREDDEEE